MEEIYNNEKRRGNTCFFAVAAFLIILDQATKLAVKGFDFGFAAHQGLEYGENIPVIGDFLQITYIENEGMAFGITFGTWKILLSLFSIIAGSFLGWLITRLNRFNFWAQTGVMFIFAGAMGNLIDRVFYGVIFGEAPLFYGRVVDFILVDIPDIHFAGLHYNYFPVFNVADSCVTVGVVILLFAHKHLPNADQIMGRRKTISQSEEINTSE